MKHWPGQNPLPFVLEKLPIGLQEQYHAVASDREIVKFADAVSVANAERPEDPNVMLALSWSLIRRAETGILIDDVGRDARRASELLAAAVQHPKVEEFASRMRLFGFGFEVDAMVARAEEFERNHSN